MFHIVYMSIEKGHFSKNLGGATIFQQNSSNSSKNKIEKSSLAKQTFCFGFQKYFFLYNSKIAKFQETAIVRIMLPNKKYHKKYV